jgi:hypothetical protein
MQRVNGSCNFANRRTSEIFSSGVEKFSVPDSGQLPDRATGKSMAVSLLAALLLRVYLNFVRERSGCNAEFCSSS